jgi:hypothetical protein
VIEPSLPTHRSESQHPKTVPERQTPANSE